MALADIEKVLNDRLKTAPWSVESQVHFPLVMPPEKVAAFAELKEKKAEMLELAHEMDELYEALTTIGNP
jgi:hypothetical protein